MFPTLTVNIQPGTIVKNQINGRSKKVLLIYTDASQTKSIHLEQCSSNNRSRTSKSHHRSRSRRSTLVSRALSRSSSSRGTTRRSGRARRARGSSRSRGCCSRSSRSGSLGWISGSSSSSRGSTCSATNNSGSRGIVSVDVVGHALEFVGGGLAGPESLAGRVESIAEVYVSHNIVSNQAKEETLGLNRGDVPKCLSPSTPQNLMAFSQPVSDETRVPARIPPSPVWQRQSKLVMAHSLSAAALGRQAQPQTFMPLRIWERLVSAAATAARREMAATEDFILTE